MGEQRVTCRPSGVVSLLQRVVDGVAGTELGASPIYVHGIGRNPKVWDNRCYFDLEDPDVPTVRLRAWMEGEKTPEWNHLIIVSALVRYKVKKPGIGIEPELEVLGIQETMVLSTSRDELRMRFAGALQRPKAVVVDMILKKNGKKMFVKRLGVSNGFPVSYLNLNIPSSLLRGASSGLKKIPAALLISEVLTDSNNF